MEPQEFLGNILAGFVGSVVTFIFVRAWRWYTFRQMFSKLNGKYTHHTINGNRLGDGITELCHMKGRIKGTGGDGRWEGRITMSEDVPEYGTSIYQYSERDDCGVHQIQVSSKGDIIYVHGVNTSHGKDYQFAYIWKKEAAEFSG